jgi:hypothetical protein
LVIDSLLEKIIKLNPILNNLLFCINADFDNHMSKFDYTSSQRHYYSYNSKKTAKK